MDTYALVWLIDEVYVVDNTIICDETFATSMRKSNGGDYDYAINVDGYDPTPGVGWNYDPIEDVFMESEQMLEDDFVNSFYNEVVPPMTDLVNALLPIDNGRKEAAIDAAISYIGSEDENVLTLFAAIKTYLMSQV